MHPREKMSTDLLVRVLEVKSMGDASGNVSATRAGPLPSDLTLESDEIRFAITSGACHPTLPGPGPAVEDWPPFECPLNDASPSALAPKLLCPNSYLPNPMSEIFAT